MEDNSPVCYIFGYGSLMYPSGINGRGLAHKYVWEDLSTATLFGYKRGMFACYLGLLYYGIVKDHNATVDGVLVPIFSKADLEVLLMDEGAHDLYKNTKAGKMYEVVNVTKTVCKNRHLVPTTAPIYALVNKVDKSEQGRITPWYVADVWNGILPWRYPFIERAQRTGIVKPANIYMRAKYLYNAIKFIREFVRR